MANRMFHPSKGSLQKGVATLYGTVNIGASGAPTLVEGSGKTGFTIARTGAGAYTITLADAYPSILMPAIVVRASAGATTDGLLPYVLTASGTTKTITFVCKTSNGAFTSADPPSGAVLHIEIGCKDSSV